MTPPSATSPPSSPPRDWSCKKKRGDMHRPRLESEESGHENPELINQCEKKKKDRPLLQWEIWEKKNNCWIDEYQKNKNNNDDFTDDKIHVIEDAIEPSPCVLLPLLRFQKEWLAWALKQEASETRGGILADEMGMGKTIQAISLVLTARHRHSSESIPSPSLPTNNKCTLVVCPMVAVKQWEEEISKYTEKGSVNVMIYYGPKRWNTSYDFSRYDFVITTYHTLEYDYRKQIMKPKDKCEYCGRSFAKKRLGVHQLYYCRHNPMRTWEHAALEKNSMVVPLEEHKTQFDYEILMGSTKRRKLMDPAERKSIPVESMGDNQSEASVKGISILHSVKWERIILDEAHFIKDRRCNIARAVFLLKSSYKWALSGTPLQNRVRELYSLVHFLQIYPYSFFFCQDCNCKVLDYGSSNHCSGCPHSTVRHFCWWNRFINNPIQYERRYGPNARVMILLKERILKSIVLRRTKKGRAADLALPPRLVILRKNSMDKNEQDFYEAMYRRSCRKFDTYALSGTLMNNYANIFELLTRLRQAVDHPYLVIYSKTSEATIEYKGETSKENCGICNNLARDVVVTTCHHAFCQSCLLEYSAMPGNASCPSCLKALAVDLKSKNSGTMVSKTMGKVYKKSGILSRLDVSNFKTSTKIDALREEIRNMIERDGSAKGIVFSQFTSFLDLINFSLEISGIKCTQLVGSMTLAAREKAIKKFTDDADCKIFLMSLKAGGIALNLTVASHVFLMDPWWNPAVERQAQDRIFRIGQFKPVRIVRFVIKDTIEERILKLQEKKELVFRGRALGDSLEAMANLTEADLKYLFQI